MLKRSKGEAWPVGTTIAAALLAVAVFLKLYASGSRRGQNFAAPSPFRSRRIRI